MLVVAIKMYLIFSIRLVCIRRENGSQVRVGVRYAHAVIPDN